MVSFQVERGHCLVYAKARLDASDQFLAPGGHVHLIGCYVVAHCHLPNATILQHTVQ
jgi:hypothetical protein